MARKTHTQDDKILELYYKALEYFNENRKRVYTVLTILVVVAAGAFIYFKGRQEKSENAMIELANIEQVYNSGAYQQAINGDSLGFTKGLLYMVNEFGSTESGQSAKVLLGNCYYYLRDFGNAERYYSDYSGSDLILKAASIAGIAAVKGAQGNYVDAAKEYENAANVSEEIAINDEYLFSAARNYSLAKDKENFDRVSALLKNDYPMSTYIMQLPRYEIN
ncbi:MAG: hypothetical protein KDC73_01015 [Ignavibacteriae bacterium]|nr:hypothetical protein [Ignavibacteriota bacterium]MCB9243100.1 hypothetical protein [Ignavibacteriales bacterium]